jgi:hypothetical protein
MRAEHPPTSSDDVVYVRFADDSRLECATISAGTGCLAADIVIVRCESEELRPARIVGSCPDGDNVVQSGVVVAGYDIDSTAATTIGDMLANSEADGAIGHGHRWGALGLPSGLNTLVTGVPEALVSDVEFALASRGYAEVETERLHRVVPGDQAVFRGEDVMVTAIDRRRDSVEFVVQHDQSILDVALSLFVEEMVTDDTVHGGA